MKIIKYSNVGNREVNEDYVVSQEIGNGISLHLVADGMGGYECGNIASEVVGNSYIYALTREMDIPEATKIASNNLRKEKRSLGVKKMGSTLAGVVIQNMDITIFWAGDSRVYLYRKGELLYQTEDHSVANELDKVRPLSFDERMRYSHLVTRSLMGETGEEVEIVKKTLQSGDEIMICSDGLYKDCPIEYILETIQQDKFDVDKHNNDFEDNHSLIYIKV